MIPSRLTVFLFALGLLAVPVAVYFPIAYLFLFAYDAALLVAATFDTLLARRWNGPRALLVRRERPARLSLGAQNDVVLVIENLSPRTLRFRLRDEAPALFVADPAEVS